MKLFLRQTAMKEPFYIQWHMTNTCNLRCQHCYQDDFSRTHDLGWSGLKEVSDTILEAMDAWDRTACIHLTGGEPLLKPELFPLLDYLDQQPAVEELGLITNGLCIDREIVRKALLIFKTDENKSLPGRGGCRDE